jgi:nitroreductase
VRAVLVAAAGDDDAMARAPLVAVLTSTFWRNAWKYQARAYRHAFWDAGAVLANLLSVLAADRRPASVVTGFADDEVNGLLGTDGRREAAVALVAIGDGAAQPPDPGPLPRLELSSEPLSTREVRYPEIEAAHAASSLASGSAAAAWRAAMRPRHDVPAPLADAPIDEVIRRRRSTRSFSGGPIRRGDLEAVLQAATLPVPGDAFDPDPVHPFLIVNAVDGLEPGAYGGDLSPIRTGRFARLAGELALWQELGATAAADVYFLSDLDAVLGRMGNRGYRVAQLAGGIAGARLELAATALGLGATGLTFFDDEVTRFFEPAAHGRQVMYLAAIGQRP